MPSMNIFSAFEKPFFRQKIYNAFADAATRHQWRAVASAEQAVMQGDAGAPFDLIALAEVFLQA